MSKGDTVNGESERAKSDGGLLPMVLAFVAGVVLVVIVVTGVVFFRQAQQRGDELRAQDDAAAAACGYAEATNSYDYTKSLDDFLAKAKEGATSNVVQMLEQNWQVMRQLLTESKVTSKVADASCGFKSGDTEQATVLVKLTLEITNSVTPVAKQQGIAVSAGMAKSGDKWLVNKWDLVVQPTETGQTGGGVQTPEAPAPQTDAPETDAPRPGGN